MRQLQYAIARGIQAAQDLGSASGAMFIAGGTDMLQLLQEDVLTPGTLVDISHLPYSGVRADEQGARIGAMARLADVADDQNIQRLYPLLGQALNETASAVVRLLTAPVVQRAVAGTWSIYWNGLADGARPRPSAWTARAVQILAARLAGHDGAGPPAIGWV